jgi:3-phosphoshikimate 1-carboxyvinyltransferase
MQVKDIELDGSESSQFLSGLLFAYAYAAKETVTITVKNLKSKPYIDLTLEVLKTFGREIKHDNYERFIIDPSLFITHEVVELHIEGDWSSAANWLIAGAINGALTIKGLNINSTQADTAIINVLQSAGVHIEVSDDIITVDRRNRILPFEFDATDCPDLFPVLSILAACCNNRESSITGVHRLMNKESNRVVSIGDMLYCFGIYFSIEDDTLVISGRSQLEYATIDSYNDHRIVMAAAIGALRAQNSVVILDTDAVNKSYPDFFRDLTSLGANCILKEQ